MDFSAIKQTLEVQRTQLSGGAAAGFAPPQPPRRGQGAAPAWPDPGLGGGLSVPSKARLDELRSVEAALARLREGSYGFCQICGDEISADWLDQRPASPFCKCCAQ